MVEIKHRYTNAVLFCGDFASVKDAVLKAKADGVDLRYADLRGADLRGADLCGANLCGADLRGANLRDADLRGANLCYANLLGADLRGASLRGVSLYGANLRGAVFDGEKIKKSSVTIGGFPWFVLITDGFMRIGCQHHSHAEWADLGEDIIAGTGGEKAVELWAIYKPILLALCAEQAK